MASTATSLVIDAITSFDGVAQNTEPGVITPATQRVQVLWDQRYSLGNSGDGKIDVRFQREVILAAAPLSFDFSAGSLTDPLGQSNLIYTTVKGIRLKNLATTAGYIVTVSGNLLTALGMSGSPTFTLDAGDYRNMDSPVDGGTVTNGASDTITLNPGANSFHVMLEVFGILAP